MEKLFNEGSVEFKITFTTRCSANCSTCLNGKISKHYELDHHLFKSLICQIIDLKIENPIKVSFYSIGESYLHPEFVDLCEWAIPNLHNVGISTLIVTNGANITKVPNGIDDFHISFNAGKKESYESITKLSFEKTVKNIYRLYNEGEFEKAGNVEIDMLCFDENENEEKDFIELFDELKTVKYRFSYKYDNQYEDTEHTGRKLQYEGIRKKIPCGYVTNSICVYPNGDIVRCSHDFFDEYIYGNLNESTLYEILNGDNRKKVLEEHRSEVYSDICQKCDYNYESDGISYFYGFFDKERSYLQEEKQGDYLEQLRVLGPSLKILLTNKKLLLYGSEGKRGSAFLQWAKENSIEVEYKHDRKHVGEATTAHEYMYQVDIIIAANRKIYLELNQSSKDIAKKIINLELYCPF